MSSSCNLTSLFASNVFNDSVMRSKLPKNVYMSLKQTIKDGEELDSAIAEVVASAMKDWAIELGATEFIVKPFEEERLMKAIKKVCG